ncbi:MAG: glycosyltransferase family 39 protein, partial [Chloroflexota bacterium]|nr:glycosyltransferase family 39 protein [Chloroflexota bacterium]
MPAFWATIAAVGITLFAFGLRAYAAHWGLPYVDHADEPTLVNIALGMLRSGDLNPHFFMYPSLYFYLLLGVFSAHYRWGQATGLYSSLDQMSITTHFYTSVPGFFVWGRMLTSVIGSLTVLNLYVLGKRMWSPGAGLIAALCVATAPYHMRHSQFVTTDVTSAWFVVLAFTSAVAIMQTGRWPSYVAAGLYAGLAAATKYNAGAVVLAVIAAHGLCWGRQALARVARLTGAGAAAVLGFVVGTPYVVLDWPHFLKDIGNQASHYGGGLHGDYLGAWNIGAYVEFFWTDGLRPAACIALVAGLVVLLWQRPKVGLLWLSFAVPYLLLFLPWQTHFMRNLMPLLVLCAVPVGVAGAVIVERVLQHAPYLSPAAAAAVLVVLYGITTRDAVTFTLFEATPNSRVLAGNFVRTLPRGQRMAVELNPAQWLGDPIVEPVSSITDHSLEWYRANNFRYLVTNDDRRDERDPQLYKAITANAKRLRVFPGARDGKPGPHVEVLDLGQQLDALAIVRRPAQFGPTIRLLGYEARPGELRPAITPLEGADERVLTA